MAAKTVRQLSTSELAADEDVILAIKNLVSYQPVVGLPTREELVAFNEQVAAAEERYLHAQNQAAAARSALLSIAMERHEAVIRTKAQVVARYGRDSDEVQAVGLKRQIDRKRRTRRTPKDSTQS